MTRGSVPGADDSPTNDSSPSGVFFIGEVAAAVLAQAEVHAWVVDEDGRYVWVNDRFAAVLGRDAGSLSGEPADPEIARYRLGLDDQSAADRPAAGPRRVSAVVDGADGAHHLEGFVFPVSAPRGKQLTGGAFTDTTELVGTRRRFADTLDRYQDMFAHAGAPLAVLDRSGAIVQVNAELRALTERTATELVAAPFWSVVGKDRAAALQRAFGELAPGISRLSSEEVLDRADGPALRCRITISRLPERRGSDWYALLAVTGVRVEREDHAKDLRPIEREVLCHVAAGATTAKVAGLTHLSRQGVDYNLRTLMDRFAVGNRAELVARAYTLGVLSPTSWPPRIAEQPYHGRRMATGTDDSAPPE
ncbi:MAG: PAS domain-containing protein [Dermatophilaceae bacterium]